MTSVRPRLFAAVPLLGLAITLMPSSAPAALPDSCNGMVDVALGAPKADVGGQTDAGSVTIAFNPDGVGLGHSADVVITESELGGTATAGDNFGASVVWGYEDADPGCSMVAVGAPGADGGRGKVYVFVLDETGVVPGSVTAITQDSGDLADTAEPGDNFGASLYFGGDLTVKWLAVGSPREDIGTHVDTGMIHVLPYASGWTTGSVAYSQGTVGVPGEDETGDHFGAALGPGRNAYSLWVGVPEEDLGSIVDAGTVVSFPGSYDPNAGPNGTLKLPGTIGYMTPITQDTTGVPSTAEASDHFGAVLSGLVGTQSTDRSPVIGVPQEDVGSATDAGTVVVAYQDGTWAQFYQGNAGVDDTAEAWDQFGGSLAVYGQVLLIGVPREDVGSVVDAGFVHRMTAMQGAIPKLSGSLEQGVSQATAGVSGDPEPGDRFGSSVAFGVNGAVIGVPGQDVGGVVDAGTIAFLPYKGGAPEMGLTATGNVVFAAGDPGFPGVLETGAGFGAVANSVTH